MPVFGESQVGRTTTAPINEKLPITDRSVSKRHNLLANKLQLAPPLVQTSA